MCWVGVSNVLVFFGDWVGYAYIMIQKCSLKVQQHLPLKSLKAKKKSKSKRRSTIWGAHFGGEGRSKERGGAWCLHKFKREAWGCIGE
jgi:hypothetical protein